MAVIAPWRVVFCALLFYYFIFLRIGGKRHANNLFNEFGFAVYVFPSRPSNGPNGLDPMEPFQERNRFIRVWPGHFVAVCLL